MICPVCKSKGEVICPRTAARERMDELIELVVVSALDGDEVEQALLDELRTLRAEG